MREDSKKGVESVACCIIRMMGFGGCQWRAGDTCQWECKLWRVIMCLPQCSLAHFFFSPVSQFRVKFWIGKQGPQQAWSSLWKYNAAGRSELKPSPNASSGRVTSSEEVMTEVWQRLCSSLRLQTNVSMWPYSNGATSPLLRVWQMKFFSYDAKGKAAKPWQDWKSCHKKVAKRRLMGAGDTPM